MVLAEWRRYHAPYALQNLVVHAEPVVLNLQIQFAGLIIQKANVNPRCKGIIRVLNQLYNRDQIARD